MIESLSRKQLTGILETIPIEISFIDDQELVRFWNKHETRLFRRPLSAAGKPVQKCHPVQSLDKVNQVISDLKSRKVYIRYFAVRDSAGRYLGTLEVTQDITAIKQIEGEKRLLEY